MTIFKKTMINKKLFENQFTQKEIVEIILPSGDVVQTEVTFTISWDTISAILKTYEDNDISNSKD